MTGNGGLNRKEKAGWLSPAFSWHIKHRGYIFQTF
ncbi:unnamed protein product, partial [marine sediment metagenome]